MRQGGCFLEGNYELKFGGQTVGRVQVQKQGLYYAFTCRCRMPGEVISRVMVRCGDRETGLGILVPMGDGFGLDTKIAAKKLGQGSPEFSVVPNRPQLTQKFIPIKPEEPFSYIERLKEAYLARQGEQVGAVLRDL